MPFDYASGGAGLAGAGLNFLGGILAMNSAESMNAANIGVAREQAQFNAAQAAAANRDAMLFNAQQGEIQRDFNWKSMESQQEFGRGQMAWSADQAVRQRDWQEMMSNSAYQRQMADMRKAGLNPILAAGSMAGASSPSGAMGQIGSSGSASAGSPSVGLSGGSGSPGRATENPGSALQRGIANAVNSAVETQKMFAGVDLMEKEGQLRDEQKRKIGYETPILEMERNKRQAEVEKAKAEANSAASRAVIDRVAAKDAQRYGSTYTPGVHERIFRTIQNRLEEIPPPFTIGPGTEHRPGEPGWEPPP